MRMCKLRKLLVCLLCNLCIFNNCSLSFKIYKLCIIVYCDVVNVQPLFNFSDEIIKFLWGDNSALTYDQPLISGTLWRVDPLTFFGLLGQQSGTFCWRYAKEIWPWMKLKQLYKGLLVSVWLCQGACSECLCACMRTFVSGRDIYVGVLGLSIFLFFAGFFSAACAVYNVLPMLVLSDLP